MKLATRPQPGNVSMAIKRLTRRLAGPIRAEYYFSFKPEASEMRLSDRDVRCVAFGFDLQESDRTGEGARRVHPIVRYLNSYEGRRVGRWQYKKGYTPFNKIGGTGETVSFYAYGDDNWEDVPGGEQRLCYNEIATKINWHYLCFDFDLETMTMTSLRCNDRTFDLRGLGSIEIPAMPNLWCMMQPLVYVSADTEKRAFMYLDSATLSAKSL
jgi:hypothetical protein